MNDYEKALDILRERGWSQDYAEDTSGRVCMMGALNLARHRPVAGVLSDPLLDRVAMEQYPERTHMDGQPVRRPVPFFNDDMSTTFADVERVLEKAAVRCEELL